MSGHMSDFYHFNVDELLLQDSSLPASYYSPHVANGVNPLHAAADLLPGPLLTVRSPSFQSIASAGSDNNSNDGVLQPAQPTAIRKRRRKSHACQTCVTAKAACTDGVPCARCVRLHRADTCAVAQSDKASTATKSTGARPGAASVSAGSEQAAKGAASSTGDAPAAGIPDDLWTVSDTSADRQLQSTVVLQLWLKMLSLFHHQAAGQPAPSGPLKAEELVRYSHLIRSISATCVGDDLRAAKEAIADTWYSHATAEQRVWLMERQVVDDFSASPSQPMADLVHTPSLPTVIYTLVDPSTPISPSCNVGVHYGSMTAVQHHALSSAEQLETLMQHPDMVVPVPRSVVVNEAFARAFGWTQLEVKQMFVEYGELGLNAYTEPHAKFRRLRSQARQQSDLLLSDQVDWGALAQAANVASTDWRSLWLLYYAAARASPQKQQVTRKVIMTCNDGKAVPCVWSKSDHMLSLMRARMTVITLQPIPD